MARAFGRIYASAWASGSDFRNLSRPAQGTYAFLISQPDMNQAGLIGLRLNRWVMAAEGYEMDALLEELRELEAKRYLVIDWGEEEVLVRTFVRNDKVYRQPNVMLAAMKDAHEIASPRLRAVLVEELHKIPLDELADEVVGKATKSPRAIVSEAIETLAEEFAEDIRRVSQLPMVDHGEPENPPGRVREGFGESFAEGSRGVNARVSPSTTTTPSTSSAPTVRAAHAAAPADPPPDEPDDGAFALAADGQPAETQGQLANRLARAFTDRVSMSNFKAVQGVVRTCLKRRDGGHHQHSNEDIEAAMIRLAADGRTPTAESLRRELEGPPKTTRASTSDAAFRQTQALKRGPAPGPHRPAIGA